MRRPTPILIYCTLQTITDTSTKKRETFILDRSLTYVRDDKMTKFLYWFLYRTHAASASSLIRASTKLTFNSLRPEVDASSATFRSTPEGAKVNASSA